MKLSITMATFWLLFALDAAAADDWSDCLSCHRERDAALVAAWEQDRHNTPEITCRSCHGSDHDGRMAARSRRQEACTDAGCHHRENGSHALS
ncbi:MAG: hypothetical protein HQL59_05120, partial [Magnetococcales bacterium]|nr:hypothetical protein [Magnetococcales bacterium]